MKFCFRPPGNMYMLRASAQTTPEHENTQEHGADTSWYENMQENVLQTALEHAKPCQCPRPPQSMKMSRRLVQNTSQQEKILENLLQTIWEHAKSCVKCPIPPQSMENEQ